MQFDEPIYVTKSTLADLDRYTELLCEVWESGILTHNGPKLRDLESEIDQFLGVDSTVAVTNGTVAMQLALRALEIYEGEVITTPFSWVATCSSILWERCTPVFVDIEPGSFNIDPNLIERAITPKTRAILPVHVFSAPCDVVAIEGISKRNGIPVIYDAAHAFGVEVKGQSVFSYGDISTTSFHATKLFNTGEGGACFASGDLKEKLKSLRFFGHDTDKKIVDVGCNAKMTELHASLGLANLPSVPEVIQKRRAIFDTYRDTLGNCVEYQQFDPDSYNYSYMPVVFESERLLLEVLERLNSANVFPRRYFNPSLNEVESIREVSNGSLDCPVSEGLSRRILALPSYNALTLEDVATIGKIIKP